MKAFRASPLDNELRGLAFSILRRLSGRIGHLPESYLLSDKFDISGKVIASGGFADVRMGVFKGKNVAVKTLRVSVADDKTRIRRVREQATISCLVTHALYSTSAKKLPCGRTCPIRTSSISLESLTPSRKGCSLWSLNGWPTVISWSMSATTLAITFSLWATITYPSPLAEYLSARGRCRRIELPPQS